VPSPGLDPGDVAGLAETVHQLRPNSCGAAGIPADLGRHSGEAVAGQRRQHQVERVPGGAAVRGRVRQRADDLEQLDHRSGQPCVMISGNASSCGDLTWMKWMPSPSNDHRFCVAPGRHPGRHAASDPWPALAAWSARSVYAANDTAAAGRRGADDLGREPPQGRARGVDQGFLPARCGTRDARMMPADPPAEAVRPGERDPS